MTNEEHQWSGGGGKRCGRRGDAAGNNVTIGVAAEKKNGIALLLRLIAAAQWQTYRAAHGIAHQAGQRIGDAVSGAEE